MDREGDSIGVLPYDPPLFGGELGDQGLADCFFESIAVDGGFFSGRDTDDLVGGDAAIEGVELSEVFGLGVVGIIDDDDLARKKGRRNSQDGEAKEGAKEKAEDHGFRR
ncbi:MAG: hypothetical protein ACJAQT_001937 [Akkermansiaceae bacterium]